MPSKLKTPTVRKPLAARVPLVMHRKLAAVVALWGEQLKAQARRLREAGHTEEAEQAELEAAQVDATFVLETLLGSALDAELDNFGGFPQSPARLAAALEAIRTANLKQ